MNMHIHFGKAVASVAITCVAIAAASSASAQQDRKSPHEVVNQTLAGKQITISYGRPSARERKIMGEVVPYGQVWRTGADEATTLTTPVNLNIGGAEVAAGKYTLWTLPSEGTWKLIINKETGQWGTNYDGGQDLARVDMKKSHLEQAVNQFTISWTKHDERTADLVFEWEKVRVWVPVQVK